MRFARRRVVFACKPGKDEIRFRLVDRKAKTTGAVRAKADPGNENHVAAPMPGVIASVAVEAGRKVAAGDILLTIEAMKMETAIHAERDGKIARVAVTPGDAVDAKDLLVEYES